MTSRNSPYYPLAWRVDYSDRAGWETIAAFNVESVAVAYAADCRKANGHRLGVKYRVMKRGNRQWVEVK